MYVINILTYNMHINFQKNHLIFDRGIVKRQGKGDDIIFLNTTFGLSNCRTQKYVGAQLFFYPRKCLQDILKSLAMPQGKIREGFSCLLRQK